MIRSEPDSPQSWGAEGGGTGRCSTRGAGAGKCPAQGHLSEGHLCLKHINKCLHICRDMFVYIFSIFSNNLFFCVFFYNVTPELNYTIIFDHVFNS